MASIAQAFFCNQLLIRILSLLFHASIAQAFFCNDVTTLTVDVLSELQSHKRSSVTTRVSERILRERVASIAQAFFCNNYIDGFDEVISNASIAQAFFCNTLLRHALA